MCFLSKIQRFIEYGHLLVKTDRVLLGLSGGADSVCLLLVLKELGYDVACAHCNFHLRGDESDRDERFVRDLCSNMGITLHVRQFDTKKYARNGDMSIEMAARELRYDWFKQLMEEEKYNRLAIAHHSDDNIETVLINMMRGCGLKGLCGIQKKNGKIVRPLLCCSHQEVLDFLGSRGQDYMTDSTNLATDFLRNKIRLDIIPKLEEAVQSAKENILTTLANINEERRVYEWCMARMMEETTFVDDEGMLKISKEALLRSPSPLSLLHESLRECGFNRTQLTQVLRSINNTGRQFFSEEFTLTIDRNYLIVVGNDDAEFQQQEIPCSTETGIIDLPYGKQLRFRLCDASGLSIVKDKNHAYLDTDKAGQSLTLRLVRTGDRFRPFGMQGQKLVSDLLTDLKLSKIEKDRQLVVETNGQIAWVIGRRTSEDFRIDGKTQTVIELELV